MYVTYLVVTALTAVANAGAAAADLRRTRFVLGSMAEVGIREPWLPLLGTLKAAGAAGLVAGVVGVVTDRPALSVLGIAAASGLTLFFTGAVVVHLRARVLHNLHFPGAFWLLGVASLALGLARQG